MDIEVLKDRHLSIEQFTKLDWFHLVSRKKIRVECPNHRETYVYNLCDRILIQITI